MQTVILAGGLATRMFPLTERIPKSMIPVHGKPFLEYQINLLKKGGITDILLCVGHLGEQIEDYFGNGDAFGVRIRYSREGNRLLGTGGALRLALALLDTAFLVMYGDSYLMLDYGDVAESFQRTDLDGLMVVYENRDRYDRSNVVVRDGVVTTYDKRVRSPEMVYIDAGMIALRRSVIETVPCERAVSLEPVLQGLVAAGRLAAYKTEQRFYEVGSPGGLAEFDALVRAGGHHG